jgi:hypothetical protein
MKIIHKSSNCQYQLKKGTFFEERGLRHSGAAGSLDFNFGYWQIHGVVPRVAQGEE